MKVKSYLRIKSHAVVANGPSPLNHDFKVCFRNSYFASFGSSLNCYVNRFDVSAPLSPWFLVPMILLGVLFFVVCPIVVVIIGVRMHRNKKVAAESEIASSAYPRKTHMNNYKENQAYDTTTP